MTRSVILVRIAMVVLACVAGAPTRADDFSASPPARPSRATAPESAARGKIRMMLMGKVDGMNAAQEGIFHEDVTTAVAPFFPVGQNLKDTEAVLREQDLGTLRKFKGEQDPAKGTMYVTTFMLMNGMASSIRVVLDFDFDGSTRETMIVRSMTAFISAKSM